MDFGNDRIIVTYNDQEEIIKKVSARESSVPSGGPESIMEQANVTTDLPPSKLALTRKNSASPEDSIYKFAVEKGVLLMNNKDESERNDIQSMREFAKNTPQKMALVEQHFENQDRTSPPPAKGKQVGI